MSNLDLRGSILTLTINGNDFIAFLPIINNLTYQYRRKENDK